MFPVTVFTTGCNPILYGSFRCHGPLGGTEGRRERQGGKKRRREEDRDDEGRGKNAKREGGNVMGVK